MASGRINRNVPSTRLGGLLAVCGSHHVTFGDRPAWPAKCHRTVEANIRSHRLRRTAGVESSFPYGPERCPGKGINPSNEPRSRPRWRDEFNASPTSSCFVCITSECPPTLKGIEPRRTGIGFRLALAHSRPMPRLHIRASDRIDRRPVEVCRRVVAPVSGRDRRREAARATSFAFTSKRGDTLKLVEPIAVRKGIPCPDITRRSPT